MPTADIHLPGELALAHQLGKGSIVERLNQWMMLVANVGVVAGIAFLAYEIQVNTDAVRSTSYEAYNETANSFLDFWAEHASTLARVQVEHTAIESLSPEDTIVYLAYAMKTFNSMEATFLHHRAGSLDEDVFQGRKAGFQNAMSFVPPGTSNLLPQAWAWLRTNGFSSEFQAFMETELMPNQGATTQTN